jgi:hypothetical protein
VVPMCQRHFVISEKKFSEQIEGELAVTTRGAINVKERQLWRSSASLRRLNAMELLASSNVFVFEIKLDLDMGRPMIRGGSVELELNLLYL